MAFDDCPAPDHLEMISTAGADADDRAERDRCVRIVRNLEVGAWVEFKHRDGASTRARLAWISATSGNYLFTNRQGHKVVESSPLGLAVELREGNARALDDRGVVRSCAREPDEQAACTGNGLTKLVSVQKGRALALAQGCANEFDKP